MNRLRTLVLALALAAGACSRNPQRLAAGQNPLDALTATEIRATVTVLRGAGKLPEGSRVGAVYLHEPAKEAILSNRPVARQAFAVVADIAHNSTYEAVVDISTRKLVSWTLKPGAQTPVTGEDSSLADTIVRADGRWREAMRRRGIREGDDVSTVCWPGGYFGFEAEENARVVRVVTYYRGGGNNDIARPVEGVVADVNLTAASVIRFVDTGIVPVPSEDGAYPPTRPASAKASRTSSGIRLVNGEVTWNHWRFHFAPHPREGVVLHRVRWMDHGRPRSVLYRASLAEMLVPYGDPGPGWFFRNSFDVGELGLGRGMLAFTPGADCPADAMLFDAAFADASGEPRTQPRAIALFERPVGTAWRHNDDFAAANELVLKFFSNLGNYDYGFEWIFRADGSIEVRVLLTGIMSVKAVAGNSAEHSPQHGHMVAPNLAAIHHQHFFCFRLDFDIDGNAPNRVIEVNTQALPRGKGNPFGNGFESTETVLRTEKEAQRRTQESSGRRWLVVNPNALNKLGSPSGYALLPGENALPFAAPESWIRRRGGFLNAHLWATPYQPGETYPAGDYPNQSKGGDGLPRWTAQNRAIADRDVVVWYTMGVTHLPRPEDWPVMPVYEAGFKLLPAGFFARNPVLDAQK